MIRTFLGGNASLQYKKSVILIVACAMLSFTACSSGENEEQKMKGSNQLESDIQTETSAEIQTEVTTEIPEEIQTEVTTETPAEIHAETSSEITTGIISEISTGITSNISTEIPAEISLEEIENGSGNESVFAKRLLIGEPMVVPANGNDKAERTVTICFDENEEAGFGKAYIELDNIRTDIGEFGSLCEAYLLGLDDGRQFVILDADYMSDDYVTYVYEITSQGLNKTDEVDGLSLIDGTVEARQLTLSVHLDVLGTYQSLMEYKIDEEGKLKQQEDIFTIVQKDFPQMIITTVKELPVTVGGQETVLEPGSRIRIIATDNTDTAFYRREDDGTEGEIHFTRGDEEGNMWMIFIDGIPDYEYFESLPYAG